MQIFPGNFRPFTFPDRITSELDLSNRGIYNYFQKKIRKCPRTLRDFQNFETGKLREVSRTFWDFQQQQKHTR
jgi:hypothetical protein